MDAYPVDPVAKRFDRLLALTAYGLLIVSVFTFWVPALVAAAIAYAHRRDSDPLNGSHFRFQLTIFWVGVVLFLLAVVAFVSAGGFALGGAIAALPGLSWSTISAAPSMGAGGAALLLLVGGVGLLALGTLWTLGAAAWGCLRLVSDRPIGQSRTGRELEIR